MLTKMLKFYLRKVFLQNIPKRSLTNKYFDLINVQKLLFPTYYLLVYQQSFLTIYEKFVQIKIILIPSIVNK